MKDNIVFKRYERKEVKAEMETETEMGTGKLSIVATPIGNLKDITYRAVETLKNCDMIACENTSEAQKLLKHYDINTPTTLYFANSKLSHSDKILKILKESGNVCLISDAGTPTISDPGVLLVQEVLKSLPECKIESIPGPSAIITALTLTGFSGNEFIFFGFVPHKKGRETLVKKMINSDITTIVYESVHRIEKFLQSLNSVMSLESNYLSRQIVVARELTKMHEQVVRGNILHVLEYFKNNQDKVRGEFVVILEGK